MRGQFQANAIVVLVNLICGCTAIGNHTAQANVVIFGLGTNGLNNAVHGKDGVKIVGRDNHGAVGMLQGSGKATAHHIAQHIKNDHVGVL